MFAQDLSNDIATILVRSDIRSIGFHKYSLFNIHFPDKSGPGFSIANHFNLDNNIGFEYFGYVLIGTGGATAISLGSMSSAEAVPVVKNKFRFHNLSEM